MKISKAEWNKYIQTMSQLSNKASKEFSDWANKNGGWEGIDRQLLAEAAWSIASKYAEGSSALAAEMYDSIALAENMNVPSAELSADVEFGQLAKAINGALKHSTNDDFVSSPVGRAVKQAGADTILKNASRDGAEFAWIPSGDTCPFCLVIASNGWRRASKKNTNGGHAEHIHTNCNCQYAIRFNKNTQVEGYDPSVYQKMYYDAEGNNSKEKLKSLQSAHYEANKDEINARKRERYAEASLRTKSGGEFGVNWKIVKSKEYTSSFDEISDNPEANKLAAQRARNALVNRNGKKSEEIYAISLTSGKDVSKIIDQDFEFAIERTEKFDQDVKRAIDKGDKLLFIHNHPRGYPPSIVDLNELINTPNSIGITVGHDGSIYLYSAPIRKIEESDEDIATMKLSWYSDDEKINQERILEELSKNFKFDFKKIR